MRYTGDIFGNKTRARFSSEVKRHRRGCGLTFSQALLLKELDGEMDMMLTYEVKFRQSLPASFILLSIRDLQIINRVLNQEQLLWIGSNHPLVPSPDPCADLHGSKAARAIQEKPRADKDSIRAEGTILLAELVRFDHIYQPRWLTCITQTLTRLAKHDPAYTAQCICPLTCLRDRMLTAKWWKDLYAVNSTIPRVILSQTHGQDLHLVQSRSHTK